MAALIDVAKRQLGYTNADEQGEELIRDLLDEGKSFLGRFCKDIDFETEFDVRGLLIEYVRYAMSNARDDFRQNYRKELISLSDRGRVRNALIQKE